MNRRDFLALALLPRLRPVSRSEARELGEGWAPFRSVATWYLWRSLDPLPVDY